MLNDPNNVQDEMLDAGPAPAPKPGVVYPTDGKPQIQWHAGLNTKALLQDYQAARNGSINAYLTQALDAHRASGEPWRSDMRVSPLDRDARVTSRYGNRIHPVTGKPDGHPALDVAPYDGGANVVSMLPGTILYAGNFSNQAGYSVMILNDNGEIDFYAHMKAGSILHMHPGERVRQGQIIGEMGMTGYATGPHVHVTTRVLDPNAMQVSALAQAQKLPGYVAPVIIDATTNLPMPIKPLVDPALDWLKYTNIHPKINGSEYAMRDAVPTVTPQQALPVADAAEIPAGSNLPVRPGDSIGKGQPTPPFKR